VAQAADTAVLRPVSQEVSNQFLNAAGTGCSTAGNLCWQEVDDTAGTDSCAGTDVASDGTTTYIRTIVTSGSIRFNLDESSIPDGATVNSVSVSLCAQRTAQATLITPSFCLNGASCTAGTGQSLNSAWTRHNVVLNVADFTKGSTSDFEIKLDHSADTRGANVSAIGVVVTYTSGSTSYPRTASDSVGVSDSLDATVTPGGSQPQTYPVTAADSVGVGDSLERLAIPGGTGYFGYPWATGSDFTVTAGTQQTWWASTSQTADSDGTLTNVYWFGSTQASYNLQVRVAVYDRTGTGFADTTLVAQSDLVSYTENQALGWHAIPISGTVQAGHNYLVAIGWTNTGGFARLRGVNVAFGDVAKRTGAPADLSFPSSLTGWTGTNIFRPDLYATYNFQTGTSYPVTAADSVALSDSLAVTKFKNYALADSAGFSDSIAIGQNKNFSLADSAAFADSISASKITGSTLYTRTASDSLNITENGVALVIRPFNGDSAGIADSIVAVKIGGAQFYPRTAADSVGLSDSIARSMFRTKTAADSVALADAIARTASHPRSLNDGVTATDSIARFITRSKTLGDSVAITDLIARSAYKPRTLADSTAIAATLARNTGRFKTESTGFADTVAVSAKYNRSISDSISLGESLSLSAAGSISQTDSAGITDSLTRRATFFRTSADGVGVNAAVAAVASHPRTRSEAASFADSIAVRSNRFRNVADGAGIADVITVSVIPGGTSKKKVVIIS
jgi:hypothetical protein